MSTAAARGSTGPRGPGPRSTRAERGTSLLELVVTATVVLGAILATVGVVDVSSRATAAARQRDAASALAVSELEALRATPYADLGLSDSAPGFQSTYDGRPTVVVPTSTIHPVSTERVDGVDHTVRRHVTWESVSDGPQSVEEGYKRLTVEVSWSAGPERSVRAEGAVGPSSTRLFCSRDWVDGTAVALAGIVNTYVPITTAAVAGATEIAVGAATAGPALASGDLLLVIQMTGEGAGTYEYALAGSGTAGGRLAVWGTGTEGGLRNGYPAGGPGSSQVVRVPTYGDVALTAAVTGPVWDGAVGGVVAMDVTGSMTGSGVVSADGLGADIAVPPAAADGSRLAPGGGVGARGGGVVALRLGSVAGSLRASAEGAAGPTGGRGGTVLATTTSVRGSVTASARGGAGVPGPGGSGGTVLTSRPPAMADVAGGPGTPPGAAGTATSTVRRVVGTDRGVGCQPAPVVTKATSTPAVATSGGASVRWTITVTNPAERGTATALVVADPLPTGLRYAATESVEAIDGATRDTTTDPDPGTSTPAWDSFTLPAGGTVRITFTVSVAAGRVGLVGNDALATFTAPAGPGRAAYFAGSSTAEDVGLVLYACPTPQGSPDPGAVTGNVNAFYPVTAAVAAGAVSLPVGTRTGTGSIAAGDLLLVIQMTGADAGRYEYAVASGAVASSRVAINGRGAGGGLLNAYGGASGAAQVVRVPNYATMTLSRTLTPTTWNGSTGGVLAVDVTGALTLASGTLNVTSVGLPAGTPGRVNGEGAGASAAPDRAPAGVGAGSARGGGVALVRAGSITGTTASVTASGAAASAAGGGGSVVITAASGSFSGLAVTARGGNGSVGGGGGAILLGGVPAVADVSGGTGSTPGAAGRARTDVGLSDLPGPALGVGCRPVVTVATTTATPATWRVVGAQVTSTTTVSNLAGRPPLEGAGVVVPLPGGLTLSSSAAPVLAGGASRPATIAPVAESATPAWGTFTIPGGGSVQLAHTAVLGPSTPVGVLSTSAGVSGTSAGAPVMATQDGTLVTTDDVNVATVASSAVPVSTTDSLGPTITTDTQPGGGLTGVVNRYHPVGATAAAGTRSISLGASTGAGRAIAAGDLLLVVDMQDATVSAVNSDAYGDGVAAGAGSGLVSAGSSGRFEYVVATSAVATTGGTVSVVGTGPAGGLLHSYTVAAATASAGAKRAQVIRVPTYPTATLTSGLTATAWNGSTGGVLAIDVTGDLALGGATVDTSGLGYRGGGRRVGASVANRGFMGTAASNQGGAKGEGWAGTPRWVFGTSVTDTAADGVPGGSLLRGAPANAGGGGGAIGGGGGGGANGGAGGGGGNSSDQPTLAGGGTGAAPVEADGLRLAPGGGGGAGDTTTGSTTASSGSPGGALVMVRAATLSGTGRLRANGAAAPVTTTGGGGGGGAGGSVMVVAGAGWAGLDVEARGGAGGATAPGGGPGGGGGGGMVATSAAPGSVDVGGGAAGSGGTAGAGAGSEGHAVGASDVAGVPLGLSPVPWIWPLVGEDGRVRVTGAAPSAYSTTRYLDVDATVPPVTSQAIAVPGGPVDARVEVRLAADEPGSTVCFYAVLYRISTGTPMSSGGGLGSSSANAGCATGTDLRSFSLPVTARAWTAAELGDVRIRLFVRSTGSGRLRLDRAALAFAWQDGAWVAQPVSFTDALTGTAAAAVVDPLAKADGVVLPATAAPPTAFATDRSIRFRFGVPLADGASVASGSLLLRWRLTAAGQVCGYLELWSGSDPIGTAGSPASPVCRSSTSFANDTFVLPAVTAAQARDLTVRFVARTVSGAPRVEVDQAVLSLAWSRS